MYCLRQENKNGGKTNFNRRLIVYFKRLHEIITTTAQKPVISLLFIATSVTTDIKPALWRVILIKKAREPVYLVRV